MMDITDAASRTEFIGTASAREAQQQKKEGTNISIIDKSLAQDCITRDNSLKHVIETCGTALWLLEYPKPALHSALILC